MYDSKLLEPFEGKLYQSLNGDFTTREGFQHADKLNEWTEAPDWDPDPEISCGKGLHVIAGHPLFSLRFTSRKEPIFFEVVTDPNPPVPSKDNDGKFRAKRVKKIREITDSEPEFRPEVLADIAKNDDHLDVRQAAVDKLNLKTHIELLADIAKNANHWDVCQAARARLHSLVL